MSSGGFHKKYLSEKLKDPDFEAAYKQAQSEIDQIDQIMRSLEQLRVEADISKAELARKIGRNDASVRRWLTSESNPELRNVVAMLDAVGGELQVVPKDKSSRLAA